MYLSNLFMFIDVFIVAAERQAMARDVYERRQRHFCTSTYGLQCSTKTSHTCLYP